LVTNLKLIYIHIYFYLFIYSHFQFQKYRCDTQNTLTTIVLSTFILTILFLAILRRILEILIYCFMNSHNEYTGRFDIDTHAYNSNNLLYSFYLYSYFDVVYPFFSMFLLYVYFFGLNYLLNSMQLKKASSITFRNYGKKFFINKLSSVFNQLFSAFCSFF